MDNNSKSESLIRQYFFGKEIELVEVDEKKNHRIYDNESDRIKYYGLNPSWNTGDKPENVIANIKLFYSYLKKQTNQEFTFVSAHCQYSNKTYSLKQSDIQNLKTLKEITISSDNENIKKFGEFSSKIDLDKIKIVGCDAVITDVPGLALCSRNADAIPVKFSYEKNGKTVIGICSAPHDSIYVNLMENAVKEMIDGYQCDPNEIKVYMDPGRRQESYEVGQDLYDKFTKKDDKYTQFFKNTQNEKKYLFDMPGIIKFQLQNSGILKANISDCEIDIGKYPDKYFSYRDMVALGVNEPGKANCGRNLSTIMILKNKENLSQQQTL